MIKINLLATRDVKKKETMQQQIIIAVLALFATLGLIAYFHIGINNAIANIIQEKKDVNEEIKSLQKEAKALKKYKRQLKALGIRKKVIKKLQVERNGPVMVMDELAMTMPRELWIDDLKLRSGKLTIKGYAADNETLANFMRGLNKSNFFKNINLSQSKKSKKSGLTVNIFTLSMRVMYPKLEGGEEEVKEVKKK